MESAVNTGKIAARSQHPRERTAQRWARTRPERRRYNGRSAVGVAVRKAVRELKAALNLADPINPIMAAAIQRAAELDVIAAGLRARRLRGEPVNTFELVRAENAHRRAISALGITTYLQPEPEPRSIAQYLKATERGNG